MILCLVHDSTANTVKAFCMQFGGMFRPGVSVAGRRSEARECQLCEYLKDLGLLICSIVVDTYRKLLV